MMKRILLVMVMVLLVAGTVSAQFPRNAYYALYADAGHTTYCLNGAGSFTMYFFALPSEGLGGGGLKCVEVKTVLNGNMAAFSPVYNPDVLQPVMGGVPGDLAACFGNCHLIEDGWFEVFNCSLFLMDMNPGSVTMEQFTGSDFLKCLDCAGVELEATPYTYLYTNYAECPGIATKESTWGAIKNMYE